MFRKNLPTSEYSISDLSILGLMQYFSFPVYVVLFLSWNLNLTPISVVLAQEITPKTAITQLLFKAAKINDIDAARAAIQAGAELSWTNSNGQTAMDIAISNNHFKMANYLVFARRIEQQIARKLPLTINSVQQISPEAAPIVERSRNKLSFSERSPRNNAKKTEERKIKNELKPGQKKMAKQLSGTLNKNNFTADNNLRSIATSETEKKLNPTRNIMAPDEKKIKALKTLAQLKQKKILVTEHNSIKLNKSDPTPDQKSNKATLPIIEKRPNTKIIKFDKNTKKTEVKKLKPSKQIFVMDPDGNLIQLTLKEFKDVQRTIKQKVDRSLPDIEPRKSLFIPKPRLKPKFHQPVVERSIVSVKSRTRTSIEEGDKSNIKGPQTSSLQNNNPKGRKLSKSLTIKKNKVNIDRIRPVRRISPELIKKLQSNLEKTKYQGEKKSKNIVIKKLSPSSTNQSNLKNKVEMNSKSPRENHTQRSLDSSSRLEKDKMINSSKSQDTNLFAKIFSGVTDFFNVKKSEHKANKSITKIINVQKPGDVAKGRLQPELSLPLLPSKATKINLKSDGEDPNSDLSSNSENLHSSTSNKNISKQLSSQIYAPIRHKAYDLSAEPRLKFYKNTKIKKPYFRNDKTDKVLIRQPNKTMPLTRLNKPLKNIRLILGNSVTTGQTKLPPGIAEPNPCIQKRRGEISFCIVPIDWPQKIENSFFINTSLYQGTRAIARFDKDIATHFHVLYTSQDHNKIINFLKKRYGPPTDIWNRVIAPFGKPRQPNPTFVWRSINTSTNEIAIIEVRKFDDTRTVFPDIEHGAIRLYNAGGPPVFPVITAHDIMSIDWAARSDHLDDGSPIMARTIRVGP